LPVGGFLPWVVGSPVLCDGIWRIGLLSVFFVLRWSELEMAKSATTPFNKFVVAVFLQVWISCAVSPPLADRGGEERWRDTGGSTPVRAAEALLPPLACLGGRGKGWLSSWRSDQAWKLIPGTSACWSDPLLPRSLAGLGGEGRMSWMWMLLVSLRRL
jgi:hypothetical protein